jgi:hypothetical protein
LSSQKRAWTDRPDYHAQGIEAAGPLGPQEFALIMNFA